MTPLFWIPALSGGILIGVSAALLLALTGRIAGISGMINGAFSLKASEQWRWFFLVGLYLGGGLYEYGLAAHPTPSSPLDPRVMLVGGFLVGFGTRLGNGCTSGHGVCGLGRLSFRSFVAVLTFLTTGITTVFLIRHIL
jgi:uncharacterized membrane protein YedE/YeeE